MKNGMTSRERVRATALGQPVDRVPVFIWINAHAGAKMMATFRPPRHAHWNAFSRYVWRKFVECGGMNAPEVWRTLPLLIDIHTLNWANMYAVDLGSDMFMAAPATPWWYARYFRQNGHIMFRDMFGVVRAIGGIYPDMVGPVIKDLKDLENYRLPSPADEKLFRMFRAARRMYPGTSIAAEIWGPQDFTATSMFGMERFMVFLVDYPEEMKKFLKRWTDWWIEVLRGCVKAGADTICILDDYGYDNRTLLSIGMWREFSYPYLKKMVDAAHEAGALVMLHSCGFQMPLLKYYVEAGIDMLQSLQPQAGNDFRQAYQEVGDKLTFVTGIDIQRGESMTAQQLKQEIIDNYRIGGRNGHHILGTTHEIQYTMPDPNLAAIYHTIREIQAGVYD